MQTQPITVISPDSLLTLYSIGLALVIFALQTKMSVTEDKRDVNLNTKIQQNAGAFRFIKMAVNLGALYFLAICLTIIAIVEKGITSLHIYLINISFFIFFAVTLALTYCYFIHVIVYSVRGWMEARKFNLDTDE